MTLVGQTLGEFEILDRLGQGGMGAVYKARQKSLRRVVALKTLQNAIADNEAYIARFQQEAIAAAALNHPNLVQVYSAGESDGLHWFSMEYVEGESARARLQREVRIEPREAVNIAICVVTALQYSWRKATLIHRDIKPDNIFLSRDGEVKLGDLGLAKNAAESHGLTSTGNSLGTPYYISPEQAQDSKSVDFRADIYSLGCTLFHMVAGRPPFQGTNSTAILLKHITEEVPTLRATWPQCPPLLSDVVEKMMQKEPGDRPQDHEELLGDLRRAYALPDASPAPTATVRPAPASAAPPEAVPVANGARSGLYEIASGLVASSASALGPAFGPAAGAASDPAASGARSGTYEIDSQVAMSASAVSVDSGYVPMVDPHRSGTYEIDSRVDASAGAVRLVRPGTKTPPPADPNGTGELRLVAPVDFDSKPPSGPIIFPPEVAGKSSRPDAPRKSFPLGKIAFALLVIVGAFSYYFTHHGKKAFASDDPADIPNPNSVWRDWVLESRRDGYFLYHRELVDHQAEVSFQRRAATLTDETFRNGKMRVRCVVPPANSPSDYVQFYVRQTRDAQGHFRRYEAYLTRESIVFAVNDSAHGAREITRWAIPQTPPVPIDIVMEIEAKGKHFTVSLNRMVVGTAEDDSIPGAGTFGVDAPAETQLTTLSFIDLDPAKAFAPASGAPAVK